MIATNTKVELSKYIVRFSPRKREKEEWKDSKKILLGFSMNAKKREERSRKNYIKKKYLKRPRMRLTKEGQAVKIRDFVLGIIAAILLLWFLISWFEVLSVSGTGIQHTYCPANIFVLLGKAAK